MTASETLITILAAPFAFLAAAYVGMNFMHSCVGWRRDGWRLHPDCRIGQALDQGGGRWLKWRGDGSDFLTWKTNR